MRGIALVWALMGSGCLAMAPIAAGTAALMPTVAPLALGSDRGGAGSVELGYVHVGNDAPHMLDSGWGLGMRSTGFVGKSLGVSMYGRTEAGVWGRDRVYGLSGMSVGAGLRAGDIGFVGAGIGYEYGGYTQIGHMFPARVIAVLHKGSIGLRGSLYGGWRVGVHDEWPAQTSRVGPGWNAWGGDLSVLLTGKLKGIGIGFGVDHQDDIHVATVFISAAMAKYGD